MDDDNLIREMIFDVEVSTDDIIDKNKVDKKRYRSIFPEELEHSKITIDNITYCVKTLASFKKTLSKFKLNQEEIIRSKNFPKMSFTIPIDNFEAENEEVVLDW